MEQAQRDRVAAPGGRGSAGYRAAALALLRSPRRRGQLHARRGADVHRPAHPEPADPAAGRDRRHPVAAARREGLRLTRAGTVLLDASRNVLSLVDHEVSRTRQAAGLGRQRLRVVVPPGLPDALAVETASALRSAAAAADVDVVWLETPLDAEFSLIRQRRADAGLGWLTTSPEALPAPLDVMSLGEFEPDVWIPSSHAAARRGSISLDEMVSMDVIHGPRRAEAGTYDAWTRVLRAVDPRFEFTDPPFRHSLPMALAFAATGDGHRGADRPQRHRRDPARADPGCPGRGSATTWSGSVRQSSADRDGVPGMERRPAPPAPADPLRHRGRRDLAGPGPIRRAVPVSTLHPAGQLLVPPRQAGDTRTYDAATDPPDVASGVTSPDQRICGWASAPARRRSSRLVGRSTSSQPRNYGWRPCCGAPPARRL